MKLYSMNDAARYLEMSLSNLKYHVHVGKNISPQKIGNSLVFDKSMLDRFLIERRKPGRPRKDTES